MCEIGMNIYQCWHQLMHFSAFSNLFLNCFPTRQNDILIMIRLTEDVSFDVHE